MKRPRNPLPDLTPLADLAWLLVMFFALTAKAQFPREEGIDLPKSDSAYHGACGAIFVEIRVPESQHVTLRMSEPLRIQLAQLIAEADRRGQTQDIENYFDASVVEWGGNYAPLGGKHQTNAPSRYSRSLENAFRCIDLLRSVEKNIQFSLFADQNLSCGLVNRVLNGLQVRGINRIYLITHLETDPTASI